MEGWKDGMMEGMEEWNDGRMEGWKDGRMEGWKDGRMANLPFLRFRPCGALNGALFSASHTFSRVSSLRRSRLW